MTQHDEQPSTARPMWKERERKLRPAPEAAAPTISRGQLPTPFEVGGFEPAWNLNGALDETELHQVHEERMGRDEEDKFEMVTALIEQELEENEQHRWEICSMLEEEERAAQQEEAEEVQQHDEDNEALQDEIEALMREIRIQAHEHGLRQVEAHINKSHQVTLKNTTEADQEIDAIQEFFMNSIVAQQERILEEQGTQRERGVGDRRGEREKGGRIRCTSLDSTLISRFLSLRKRKVRSMSRQLRLQHSAMPRLQGSR